MITALRAVLIGFFVLHTVPPAATETLGQFCLMKAGAMKYLRNTKDDAVKADRAYSQQCTACERWIMERRKGKISLESLCERGKYLQAQADGTVSVGRDMQLWRWRIGDAKTASSFESEHGRWLSADVNGTMYTIKERSFDGPWIVPLADRPKVVLLAEISKR